MMGPPHPLGPGPPFDCFRHDPTLCSATLEHDGRCWPCECALHAGFHHATLPDGQRLYWGPDPGNPDATHPAPHIA